MSHDNLRPTRNSGRQSAAQNRSTRTRELFSLAQSTDSAEERRQLLDVVIEMHLDLAHAEAARYRSRGIALDDLRQVAALALTKAARGYDVTTGHDFLSYAVPTIRGELRKHFRDHGWMIRPPRRIQELQARINTAEAELSSRLGRSPQPKEIAAAHRRVHRGGDRGPGQRRLLRARLPRPPGGRGRAPRRWASCSLSTTTSTGPPRRG